MTTIENLEWLTQNAAVVVFLGIGFWLLTLIIDAVAQRSCARRLMTELNQARCVPTQGTAGSVSGMFRKLGRRVAHHPAAMEIANHKIATATITLNIPIRHRLLVNFAEGFGLVFTVCGSMIIFNKISSSSGSSIIANLGAIGVACWTTAIGQVISLTARYFLAQAEVQIDRVQSAARDLVLFWAECYERGAGKIKASKCRALNTADNDCNDHIATPRINPTHIRFIAQHLQTVANTNGKHEPGAAE